MPFKKNTILTDHHVYSKKTSKSVDYEKQPYFKKQPNPHQQHHQQGPPCSDNMIRTSQSMQLHHLIRQVEQLKNEMNHHDTTNQYNKFKELNKSFDQKYQQALQEYTTQKNAFKKSIDTMMINHSLYCEKQQALQHLDAIIVKMAQLQ